MERPHSIVGFRRSENVSACQPHGRRRQGGRRASNTADRRVREEQVIDSFLDDGTDASAANTHGESRKKRKMAQVSSASRQRRWFHGGHSYTACSDPFDGGAPGSSNAQLPPLPKPPLASQPVPDTQVPLPEIQSPGPPSSPLSYEEALEFLEQLEEDSSNVSCFIDELEVWQKKIRIHSLHHSKT